MWEQLNDSPFRDDHTNGFGHEGIAYLFRGIPTNTGNGPENEVWTYTPETDTWELMTTFPGPARNISIGDDWNGKYYYGFGIGGPNGLLNDLWEFDPADSSFTELPACPCVGRSHPSLIAHNDKIFMGAGSSFGGDLNDWWEYDMITQEWTQKENIPGPVRHHMFHFSIGDDVYVGGGHVLNWNKWDPINDEWTPIDDLPQGRVAGTQFQYNGLGFILAGDDRFHDHVPNFETFMYYNAENNEWDYLPSLPNGSRWAPSSFIIGDDLYFAAGLSDLVNGDASVWKFDLSLVDCLPPGGVTASNIMNNSADLFWNTNANGIGDTLKWRVLGDSEWNIVENPDVIYELEGLETCTDYEIVIAKQCSSNSSSSEPFVFTTEGCCVNPDIIVNSITANAALVEWPAIAAADEYNVRWKPTSEEDWSTLTVTASPVQLTDLLECTEYEFQIESVCSISDIDYSDSKLFLTRDCGACLDDDYCNIIESFGAEFVYINKVAINGYVNVSGNNQGYGNFADAQAEEVFIGGPFSFTLEPGYEDGAFAFDLLGWLDLNGNGEFEDSELIIQQNDVAGETSLSVLIPDDATPGLTRLRVFYSSETDPCSLSSNFVFGEAEDYCITLLEKPTSTIELDDQKLVAYPNPFNSTFIINNSSPTTFSYNVRVMNVAGQIVQEQQNYKLGEEVELSENIRAGVYFLLIDNGTEVNRIKIVKK